MNRTRPGGEKGQESGLIPAWSGPRCTANRSAASAGVLRRVANEVVAKILQSLQAYSAGNPEGIGSYSPAMSIRRLVVKAVDSEKCGRFQIVNKHTPASRQTGSTALLALQTRLAQTINRHPRLHVSENRGA